MNQSSSLTSKQQIYTNNEMIKNEEAVYAKKKREYDNAMAVYLNKIAEMKVEIQEILNTGCTFDFDVDKIEDRGYVVEKITSLENLIMELQKETIKEYRRVNNEVTGVAQ